MDKKSATKSNQSKFFPPVVAVLGHVDHGKTTLLDTIRKTNIATREHGGITQKIAASDIEVAYEGARKHITFIDTPGHEAFSKMRSRGTQAADIGLLVISSADGVMPQTRESIKLLQEAEVPFIVVLTKSDLPEKNIERVKQQLLKENVLLEGYGGDVPVIEVSAKTGHNIKELLELIILVYDLNSVKYASRSETDAFNAVVIESRLDPKLGARATVVIKNGRVEIRDTLLSESAEGRIRTLINDKGEHLKSATVGEAVEILGFEKVPPVGGLVLKKSDITEQASKTVPQLQKEPKLYSEIPEGTLAVILCADTQGSLEAIGGGLPENVLIIAKKTGDITPSDVLLAKSSGAIIIGFNARISPDILKLAKTEKVLIKNYTIIYELMDELAEVAQGNIDALQEVVLGKAKVIASFPFEKTKVLGIVVLEGRVAKGDKVRVMRGDDIVGESIVTSARQGKVQVSKIEKGQEGGILISPLVDFTIGDVLICHR